tara:strand:- start:480 stop:695 length:216 start_codon:yes stop_codon:yes gene_type:complete
MKKVCSFRKKQTGLVIDEDMNIETVIHGLRAGDTLLQVGTMKCANKPFDTVMDEIQYGKRPLRCVFSCKLR